MFEPDTEHTLANLRRVVICKPAPKERPQRHKDPYLPRRRRKISRSLRTLLGTEATPQVEYGMWTNGLDFFFLRKRSAGTGSTPSSSPGRTGRWRTTRSNPDAVASVSRMRRGEAAMLKTAFRRCHNYIHGNEGMPKDAAFWQFLYLLFAKMHDERESLPQGATRSSTSSPPSRSPTRDARRSAHRVEALFDDVKKRHNSSGRRDELTLSDRALAFIVGEIAPYNLTGTDADVKGIAYQELVGANLRGDRGQYFTPPAAVRLMVDILDPKEDETVLDPACGTGGFLRETLRHLLEKWRADEHTSGLPDTKEQLIKHQGNLATYAKDHLFGTDFDSSLVRTAAMSVMMLSGEPGNIFYLDSLAFPNGHLAGVDEARTWIPLGSVDVLMTNPPFGTDIKIEDPDILAAFRDGVARSWSRDKQTGELIVGVGEVGAMAPEELFIQRTVQWVKPGGRIGIVLPNGILSNPGPNRRRHPRLDPAQLLGVGQRGTPRGDVHS